MMIEKESLPKEVFTEISKFINDLVDFYYKREAECIKKINKKFNFSQGNDFTKIIGYSPIVQLMINQYSILFSCLSDKSITVEQFKDIYFDTLRSAFYGGISLIKEDNNISESKKH